MKMNKTRKILVVAATILLVSVTAAWALTNYLTVSNTFTIGSVFNVGGVGLGINMGTTFSGTFASCTGTLPTLTCPNPSNPLFAGDQIAYVVYAETDKPSISPVGTITAGGSFTQFTTGNFYQLAQGNNLACTAPCTVNSGLPTTMATGQWYIFYITATISTGAPTGSVTFNTNLGA